MVEDPEVLSPEEWISQSRSRSVHKKRELMVRYWTEANGFTSAPEGLKVVGSSGGLYRSIDKAVRLMESKGLSPNTLAQWRSSYKGFVQSCVGMLDVSRFDAIVKPFQGYTIREKLCPNPEEFRELLLKGNPREKALVSFLGTTGMRIGEALSRTRSDVEFDYPLGGGFKVPARVRIEAEATKRRYLRYAFLGRETVKLLKDFWAGTRKSEWVFPAMWSEGGVDNHADYFNVHKQLKALFV